MLGEGFSLPAALKNVNWHDREGCSLLAALIHLEPYVQTHMGFGTHTTCKYPYPYPSN